MALHNVAHSLGVSGNKNMLNWSEYMKQEYKNTDIDFLHLGGSYPSEEIHKQASHLFRNAKTRYHGAQGDFVYAGLLGGLFIWNNPNAKQINGLPFSDAHSEANQNINNLKYIYKNKESNDKWIKTEEIIRKVNPFDFERKSEFFNEEWLMKHTIIFLFIFLRAYSFIFYTR